jgi:hypothetical protein
MLPRTMHQFKELLLISVVGLLFYCLHFYPYFSEYSTSIFYFNDADDAKVYAWNTWHFAHQIKQGANPFYTDYICSPNGTSLWMHAYTVWFGLLNLVLNNVALSVNLGIAIQLVVAFIGFYYFAKRYVSSTYFACAAAYFSVFNSYILAKSGVHYNLVLLGVLPFLLLYTLKLFPVIEEKLSFRKKHTLVFVALLILAFFMDYYMVFYTLAFMVVYLIWYGLLAQWFEKWNWRKSAILAGLFGVSHVVLRLLRIGGFDEKGAVWGAADLRLLFTPVSTTLNKQERVLANMPNTLNDNKIYLGISLLIGFIVALVYFYTTYKKDKQARFLLFASVTFLFVTLPVIRIEGKDWFYTITGFVHYIPFVNNVRAPDRFILLFFIPASIFIFRILFLESKHKERQYLYIGTAILLASWFYIDHAQQKMKPVEQPVATHFLEEYKDQTILMLPFGIRDGYQQFGDFDEDHLLMQIKYGFKVPNGYLSRLNSDTWKYYKSNELFINLVRLQENKSSSLDLKAALLHHGYKSVFVPKSYLVQHPTLEQQLILACGEGRLLENNIVLFSVN